MVHKVVLAVVGHLIGIAHPGLHHHADLLGRFRIMAVIEVLSNRCSSFYKKVHESVEFWIVLNFLFV